MNCNSYRELLSEYQDGSLSPAERSRVETHLHDCSECAELAQDFRAIGNILRELPMAQTTSMFDERLGARIATIPARRQSRWLNQAIGFLHAPAMRPALAMGAAAVIVGGMSFLWHPAAQTNSSAIPDRVLVSHCIQQHRSYVGAQPLSDIAAQNLANQLDQTSLVSTAADTPDEGDY